MLGFRSQPTVVTARDAELRVGIDDRSESMGEEPYLGYEMCAMRYKENNKNNKHHGSERECSMNGSKGE